MVKGIQLNAAGGVLILEVDPDTHKELINMERIKDSQTIIDQVFYNFYAKADVMMSPRITDHNIIKITTNADDRKNDINKIEIYERDLTNYNEERPHGTAG